MFSNGKKSNQINCQSLKELKLLMNLKVKLLMNDIFFEGIDKHLPQLKHLSIYVGRDITDKALISVSKLQKLQSIKVDYLESTVEYLPFITDLGLIHVINNCPQINSIKFKSLYEYNK
jgi:hypothetical protein